MDAEKKIVWLASYPKSGNTWFRAFITALLNDGEVDINDMKTDGIFASRTIFENLTDLDSTYLSDEEVKILLPHVFNQLNNISIKSTNFIKVHDAYTFNSKHQPIIPTESTRCAIYIIRNPLDMAASLANHNVTSITAAIETLNNPAATLLKNDKFNSHPQFKQLMLDWSNHVKSWTTYLPFPVLVVRYEDLQKNTFETFKNAVAFMKIVVSDEQITTAIAASNFNTLKQIETTKGFKERPKNTPSFFREGKTGNYKNELTDEQIQLIVAHHKIMMKLYNYL